MHNATPCCRYTRYVTCTSYHFQLVEQNYVCTIMYMNGVKNKVKLMVRFFQDDLRDIYK